MTPSSSRIALDCRYRTRSGGAAYVNAIVPGLLDQNRGHEFVIVRHPDQVIDGADGLPTILCPPLSAPREVMWDQLRLPGLLGDHRVTLYHALKLLGSLRPPCLQLKVVHAINPSLFGSYPQTPTQHAYWALVGSAAFRRSDHLVAVSNFLRDYCVSQLGIPAERVTVIPNGIAPRFHVLAPAEGDAEFGPARGRPFLLVVGNLLPVKNQLTAVHAFAQLAPRFASHHLLLAGGTGHAYAEKVRDAAHRAGLADRVHLLGYVEPDRLVRLYNSADLLLMPSLTEGCPVSLLEAMACGLPIVGSRRGGIPEVADNAAHLIDDPEDVTTWVAVVGSMLESSAERRALRERALARAGLFSWRLAAAATLDVYEVMSSAATRR